jgi:hypothetical protein
MDVKKDNPPPKKRVIDSEDAQRDFLESITDKKWHPWDNIAQELPPISGTSTFAEGPVYVPK